MPGDRARVEARASEVTRHGNSGDDKGGQVPGLLSIIDCLGRKEGMLSFSGPFW